MTNVLIFSGGRGSKNLISSLQKIKKISSINTLVNTYDDGKSSGIVRKIFDMPGPSDVRKVQELYLDKSTSNYKIYKKIFEKRINYDFNNFIFQLKKYLEKNNQDLFGIQIKDKILNKKIKKYLNTFLLKINKKKFYSKDFSLINLIYVGAYFFYKKNLNKSIDNLSKLFEIKQKIYSCGNQNLFLCGINFKNKVFNSEAEIVEQRSNVNMREIYLTKKKLNLDNLNNEAKIKFIKSKATNDTISPEAKKLIRDTDIIIYSPGTPFSSLYPSFFCKGVGNEISKNKSANKILITNIGSDYETPHFKAKDYIKNTLKYLKMNSKSIKDNDLITHVIVNLPKRITKSHVKPILNNFIKKNHIIKLDNFEIRDKKGIHSEIKLKKILKDLIQ
tara:strand:- start:577 stop:1743 length:1167 start_codon:yes stop_codon:yes gene_type:complete